MFSSSRILRVIAVLAVFVIYDYIFWVVLFADQLGAPDMGLEGWVWFHSASAVMAICFVVLFEHRWRDAGVRAGLVFGLIAGTFWGIGEFMGYAQGSGSLSETIGNCIGDIGMFAVAGILLGSIEAGSKSRL